MKNRLTILIFAVFVTITVRAQHYSLYSQYMFNGLMINPAYAGSSNAMDLTISHRRQWSGLAMSPTNSSIAFHTPVKSDKVSLGATLMDDRVGVTTKQNLNVIYAYRLKMGESSLSFGLQGGLEFGRANWDKLIRNDADDDLLLNANQSSMDFTSGAGAYFTSKNIVAGLSLPYLVNTSSARNFLSGPFLIQGGYNFFLNDSSVIKSSVLIRAIKSSPLQADLNVIYSWKQKYGLGFSYRHQESLIALLEFNFKKQFRLCYSYDYGIGPIKTFHNGSHEITFRYLIFKGPDQSAETKKVENTVSPSEEKK